jgi:ElaA protein
MTAGQIQWTCVHYDAISADELYEALALRQRVFIVEQHCLFQDADGWDRFSWHLFGRTADGRCAAYLRIVPPGMRFDEPSIGRVVTAPEVRRTGLGRVLMQEGIRRTRDLFPGRPIMLSAQRYLENFYRSLGFAATGEPYEEDGIPHINMVLHTTP